MTGRSHMHWLGALLTLLVAFPAASGAALAAPTPPLPPPPFQKGLYYPAESYDPLSRLLVEWRILHGIEDPGLNVANAVLNVSGLTDADVRNLQADRLLPGSSFQRLGVDNGAGRIIDDSGVTLEASGAAAADERFAFSRLLYSGLDLGDWAARTGAGPVTDLLEVVVPNTANDQHSEERLVQWLARRDVAQRLLAAGSERQFCAARCEPLMREVYAEAPAPKPSFRFFLDYGRPVTAGGSTLSTAEVNRIARDSLRSLLSRARQEPAMKALVGAREARATRASGILRPGGGCGATAALAQQGQIALMGCFPSDSGAGALGEALSSSDSRAPGGIDFSSLQLRYVADDHSGGGVRYAFAAQLGTGPGDRDAGLRVAQEASDAFFVWLELPRYKLTVNLNPNEPDRIVDAQLGRTDVGRILLEADFQMKKTVARLIHPDTPMGAQFWQQLQAGSDGSVCLSMRQWIVPAPATVREDGDQLYILDAPLSVELESDYLKVAGAPQYSCSDQDRAIQQHNEAIFRSMILPQVQQAVNQAPEYAALRRVYLSRVAAEWYRSRSLIRTTAYGGQIDRGNVGPWVSHQPWSPRDIFDQYVQSYKNGEFNVTHQTQNGDVIETRTYVFGGVDFTRVPELKLTRGQFDARAQGLEGRVQRSLGQPEPDPDGRTVWLGGTTVVVAPAPRRSLPPVVVPLLVLAGVGLLAVLVLGVWRRRRLPA